MLKVNNMPYKKLTYPIILLILCLFFIYSATYWTNRDGGFTFTSDAAHLFNASEHFRNLKACDITDFILTREMYPNLVHHLISFASLITGDILKAFLFVNMIFIVILAFGVFFTGSMVWNRDTGFIAAVLSFSIPGIVFYSRINNIDIATSAAVIWSLYFLIRSDRFRNKPMTIAFFASCAVGMLTKWAFVFFLLVPFIAELLPRKNEDDGWNWKDPLIFAVILALSYTLPLIIVNFMGKDQLGFPPVDSFWIFHVIFTIILTVLFIALLFAFRAAATRLKNLSMGLVLFMLMTNHYYLFSFQYLVKTYLGRFWGKELKTHACSHNLYTFLIKFFTLDVMGIPVVILAAAGIIYYLTKAKKTEGANILLWSLGSGLLFLALQPLYINRYYLPLAGTTVLFSTFWIPQIPWKPVKALILIPLLSISFLNWAGWIFLPSSVNKIFPEIPVQRPVKATWNLKDTVNFVWKDSLAHQKKNEGIFFIFHNESTLPGIKPLVLMFYFSEKMKADDKIFFFPENINLREEVQNVPLMYYIVSDDEDNADNISNDIDNDMADDRPGKNSGMDDDNTGNDGDMGKDGHVNDREGRDRLKHDNEINWSGIKPATLYYIHFTGTDTDEKPAYNNNPEKKIERYLKPQWIQALQNKQLLRKTEIRGSDEEKIKNLKQIFIYKTELNR